MIELRNAFWGSLNDTRYIYIYGWKKDEVESGMFDGLKEGGTDVKTEEDGRRGRNGQIIYKRTSS